MVRYKALNATEGISIENGLISTMIRYKGWYKSRYEWILYWVNKYYG
ncbi:hypothetical protein [Clostridium estertheticum]